GRDMLGNGLAGLGQLGARSGQPGKQAAAHQQGAAPRVRGVLRRPKLFQFRPQGGGFILYTVAHDGFWRSSASMLVKGQRYQKSRNISGMRGLPALGAWLALFGGLTGCAGAEAPTASAAQPPVLAQAAVTPAPQLSPSAAAAAPGAASGTVSMAPSAPRVPPQIAEQALVDAREAMQKKQWSRLDELVPTASATPLVGAYAQYRALRQRVTKPTLPSP